MSEVYYCQQWSLAKGTFVLEVMKVIPRPHMLLAWLAVESGNDAKAPRGAEHNFLQIKGTGSKGRTSEGFARYRSAREAGRAARRRIKQEPGIMEARKKDRDTLFRAIANAWNDGPGVTVGTPPESYVAALHEKYNCIDSKKVVEGGFVGVQDPGGGRTGGVAGKAMGATFELAEKLIPGEHSGDRPRLPGFDFAGLAGVLWPVLLKTALAGTGLALIGYGIKGLFSSKAATATKTVAPAAAGAAQEVAR